MGNSSVRRCAEVEERIAAVKEQMADSCTAYADFTELTTALIDLSIEDLRLDLRAIEETFTAEIFRRTDLAAAEKNTICEEVNKFCNLNKHSLRTMFETVYKAYLDFHLIASEFISASGTDAEFSEQECLNQIRSASASYLCSYETQLRDVEMPKELITTRCTALRRLLYREGDKVIGSAVNEFAATIKDDIREEIDNVLCMAMTSGPLAHSNCFGTREVLKGMIGCCNSGKDRLLSIPTSRAEVIEDAIADITNYTEMMLRQVQIQFCTDPDALENLIDLAADDYEVDSVGESVGQIENEEAEQDYFEDATTIIETQPESKVGRRLTSVITSATVAERSTDKKKGKKRKSAQDNLKKMDTKEVDVGDSETPIVKKRTKRSKKD